ncbi:MAG: hypothetical protein ABFD60_04020 [Bryobacteraceae bacterium]
MGYDAVTLAVRKLRGETPPKKNPLPPLLITKENVDAPDVSIRLHPKLEF